MNKNVLLLGGVLVIVLIGLFIFISNNDAEVVVKSSVDHHLSGAKVSKGPNDFTANLNAMGLMPLRGESGAVGYGIITDKGTDQVVVTTTHGGVLDSELQKDASDPVWHNHIVKLGEVPMCGQNPGVIDITFESPGEVTVNERALRMAEVPATFDGTHSLTKKRITFAPGTDIQKVVEFILEPKFDQANVLQAVCVTNIKEVPFSLI